MNKKTPQLPEEFVSSRLTAAYLEQWVIYLTLF